jgi:hypothetical protein
MIKENLAPASQPTPPLVRHPGGVGPQKPAPFFIPSPLRPVDALVTVVSLRWLYTLAARCRIP